MKVFIDVLISCYVMYFYGQTGREEFKRALEGALKLFPGIKIKPEQELFSRPHSLKERCTRSMEKPHTSFCRNYVQVLVSQDRDKEDDISVSDI